MKYLELTEDEIQVLANMIDAAVRAQGYAIAANAVVLMRKLENSSDVEATPDSDSSE